MRRSFLVLGLVTAAVLALPPAALYYAAFTQSGLELITRLIPRRVGNLRLTIEGVTGTAVHGMHIDRVEIDDRRVHLRFEDAEGRITLSPLLVRTLRIPHASIRRVFIEVRPRGALPESHNWHFLPHGLEIQADDVQVASGTLIVPDGDRFDATRLDAAGLVTRTTTRVDRAGMTLGSLRFTGHGLLRAGSPFGMDVTTLTTIRAPGRPAWVIGASAKGDVDDLRLHVRFIAPLAAQFSGSADDLTRDWHWQGRAHVEDFELRPWHGTDAALGRVSGELALRGDHSGFTAEGTLTPSGLHGGAFQALLRGEYAHRAITVRRLAISHPASGASIVARGSIGVVVGGPRLELSGSWSNFRWPLTGRAWGLRSPAGRYELQGVWPYGLRASGTLVPRGLEPIAFRMTGLLGKRSLVVSSASLAAFGGTGRLTAGTATWSPRPSWSASGSATGVNPASLRPDLPGRLTFDFQAAGAHFDSGTSFAITLHHLSGRVRGLVAGADGTVARRGAVWTLEDVTGRLGPTAFSVAGEVSDTLDLRFKLAAQDLALFDPHLEGHLLASGSVMGPRRSPAIDAVASGGGIRGRGLSVGSFDARIDFDPRRSAPSHVHFHAHDLAYRRHHLNVAFALDGPPAHQVGTLSLSGVDYRMSSRAGGALAGGVWTGRLETLDFAGGDVRLALVSPGALSVSTRALHLGQICVRGKPARMCAAADWTPGDWSVSALAQDLPLGLLTAGISPNVHFRGVVGATVHLSSSGSGPARGELSVTVARAEMVRRRTDGRSETTQLGSGMLTVDATPDRIDGAVRLDAGSVGSIAGRIEARRGAAGWRSSPLTGTIAARTTLGAWAPLYAGLIDQAAGEASAQLTVAGTLGTPQLTGMLSLKDGALDLYRYNLEVQGAAIRARLSANGLDFSGAAHLGAGTASTQGHLEWRNGAPFGDVKLSGTSLRVVDLLEAVVDASPDLDFHIAGQQARVTGVVKIPHARLAPAGLSNAVHVSPDEIIVGEDTTSPSGKLEVTSAIEIELGDQVSIETQGLTGRLTGQVTVTSGADSITRASGELRIAGGEYAAYGRTLQIARGRLIYTSSPIDDPGIDIRAQKTFQDPDIGAAVAGIDMRGTLRNPRITFFSEPPLPQAQIVSLVLAGGTLLGGPQLGVAATAPTSRSVNAQLIGQGAAVLGSQMGLPLAIEPTYNNDTALVLGKYLSPRLYVSYGITLVQSLNIVKLRYTLGDHWALSTEFGQLGGADLVYSFEK